MKLKTKRQDVARDARAIYRARADACWRDRDAARRARAYDEAYVAERQALYWERLAIQAGEAR